MQPTANPQLQVTYSYSGNGSDGMADNFIANVNSSSDMLAVANDIAWSGGKTTNVYPDLTGGSNAYHLEITATGTWTITVTQVS